MLKFRFTGNLRRYYGKVCLNVDTPAQGLNLLVAQNHEFKKAFLSTPLRLRIAGKDYDENTAPAAVNSKYPDGTTIIIAPVVEGGIAGIGVVGWILIGVSVVSVAFSIFMSRNLKIKTSAESAQDKTITNNTYTSVENKVGQGRPVPILLGEMKIGSNVGSLGIDTSNNKDALDVVS
ncbi:tail assembly protein [Escherichia coli]|uniref:tail assembly protein n=1 Tax=Escherichia coli TaxID=562 RepID=UPI001C19AC2F|nr:tail assembly protein [Escherichia coli]MBV4815546.1 tail assembly protein [Escherichia coli]MBV5057469.1 tail assembly protein [Escherichia coli]MCG0109166.1 tail assembly protein [Escherichia coli]HBD5699991.1 tail assembly protein [Escherichia coli]HBD5770886.1 tail assembly protein [Escherichia coli]